MLLTDRRILLAVSAATVVMPLALPLSPSPLAKPDAYMGARKDEIVLTLAGDTGWITSDNHPIAEAFSAISSEINGDLNFINAETVISNREDLSPIPKGGRCTFHFLSKPTDFNYLVSHGINLISLANNHVLDYGEAGLQDTLHSLNKLEAFGLKAFAGAGYNYQEAREPKRISVGHATVAFGAIGIIGHQRGGPDRPAAADIESADDFSLILKQLRRSPANYRILSIHQGIEGRSVVDADEARLWRRAIREGELGLIAGHHAHVPRGVEIYNGAVILYGLGNFLHNGTGDLTQLNVCHSYGLLARVHIRKGADGVWRNRAVEAVPLTDTHRATRRFANISESETRIYALNFLSQQLDDSGSGAVGMRFTPQGDGTGLYCFPGATGDGGNIGALCANWKPAPPLSEDLLYRLQRSCILSISRVHPLRCLRSGLGD